MFFFHINNTTCFRKKTIVTYPRSHARHNRSPIPDLRSLVPLFILLALFFVSCSTTPAITTHISQTIEDITPQWEQIADGVFYFRGKTAFPRIEFYALRADLSSAYLGVVVSGGAQTVSGFVRDNGLIAGINATPFDENLKNVGLVVSDYKQLAPINRNYDALIFYRDMGARRAIIASQASIYSTENIENAAGGFHQILKDGAPTPRTEREGTVSAEKHPRSAAGVSADGSALYLLVIDGRRLTGSGATEAETAAILRALGATDGLNLDGGGSSALAVRFPDGNVKLANTPSEFGRERTVAACIGIVN